MRPTYTVLTNTGATIVFTLQVPNFVHEIGEYHTAVHARNLDTGEHRYWLGGSHRSADFSEKQAYAMMMEKINDCGAASVREHQPMPVHRIRKFRNHVQTLFVQSESVAPIDPEHVMFMADMLEWLGDVQNEIALNDKELTC